MNNKVIIAFSGRRCSGKDSSCNFLVRNSLELFKTDKTQRFAFATKLKEFCVDFLGLRREDVFGLDQDKENLSNLRWEDMPHYERFTFSSEAPAPTGYMTVRQVLQQVGTEWFKTLRPTIWIDLLYADVERSDSEYCFISDLRFYNEAEAVHKMGGYVIRLTRLIPEYNKDTHSSEVQMDNYPNFDYTIDNHNMTLGEQAKALVQAMSDLGLRK
jgi:hypothetical protein